MPRRSPKQPSEALARALEHTKWRVGHAFRRHAWRPPHFSSNPDTGNYHLHFSSSFFDEEVCFGDIGASPYTMGAAVLMADPERSEKNVADEDTHLDSSGEASSLGLFDLWSRELRP